ncbi:hypothetical protein PG985_000223 [Apiospora marii]|uniref:uncharacterized protein n=1 Tax=Apiospora marii TaxID=335849 RepID=UPI00312CDEC3
MHRHGAYAILLSSLAGTFAASCYPDRCLNRVDCGDGCVADCARHIAVTVTPPAVTLTSTTTIYSQFGANVSPIGPESTVVNAAPACREVAGFPYWAAVCDSRERFRSACLCIGASITTATAPTPTSTVIETIAPSSPTIGPSKTPSSTVPTSSGDSLPTGTASLKTSRTGVVSSSRTRAPDRRARHTRTTDQKETALLRGRGVKRQDAAAGGFIDVVGTVETCSDGTPFNITTEGQLTSDGRAVGARFGDIFIPLAPRDDGIDISTEFVVVDSVLHWQNAAFSGGEARFCQVGGGSGQVYATFAERDTWPPDCDSISIIVYKARQCRNGVIVLDEPGDDIPPTRLSSAMDTVPSTTYTETDMSSTLATFAPTISVDTDSATSLDGVASTIDAGQETSIAAGSTARTTSTESPPFSQMSDTVPMTSTGQGTSTVMPSSAVSEPPGTASSGLSPTTTPRSPELSSLSMGPSLFPASTELSITSSVSVLSEATNESGSPTSVEMSGSPSSMDTSYSPVSTESPITSSRSTSREETSATASSVPSETVVRYYDQFSVFRLLCGYADTGKYHKLGFKFIQLSGANFVYRFHRHIYRLDAVLELCIDLFERHDPINVGRIIIKGFLNVDSFRVSVHAHWQCGTIEHKLVGL